ncbi:MAG: porin family protein [Gammaproteobacteria bacterium]|nr:porin family protein [Gammaproteobacteria bacterium]
MSTYKTNTLSVALLPIIFSLGLLHSLLASAGETEYRVIPYIWTAGIDAKMGPPIRPAEVDVSFSDYAGFVDAGGAFVFEALGDKWSFTGNFLAVKLSEDIDRPRTVLDFENKQVVAEVFAGYRPEGWKEARIVGGVRYIDMDTKILFSDGFRVDIGADWYDPFVGLEWRPRRGKWEYIVEGDIGGGNDADFAWQALLGVNYHFSDRYAVGGGYRYLGIDFEDRTFVFDGSLEGIQIGFMFKF